MNEAIIKLMYWIMFISIGVLVYYIVMAIVDCVKAKDTPPGDETMDDYINSDILKVAQSEIEKPFNVKYFAPNTFAAFTCLFSLSIIVLHTTHTNIPAIFIISIMFGVCAMVISGLIRYSIELQTKKDALYIANAVGKNAYVKSDVPSKNSGKGIVRLLLYGKTVDFYATTLDDVTLTKGTKVEVTNVIKYNQVSVERTR